ncbi:MAG: hypothetical protein NUV68_03310 [Caldiserica bacterium]|nr:hypothetical protein [Caldisericota bacterium]MDH7562429.1 hypothetical protein [Caldisericota bacterium]
MGKKEVHSGLEREEKEYLKETQEFEENLLKGPAFIKLLFFTWFCLEPLIAIGCAGFNWLGDSPYFYFFFVLWALPGGMLALVFGAMRIAQIVTFESGGLKLMLQILFLLSQFLLAPLSYWILGWDFAQGYFVDTITYDFLSLTLVVGISFLPLSLKERKFWFLPLFLYAYLIPAGLLGFFHFQGLSLSGDISFWRYLEFFGGILAQIILLFSSTSGLALRGFSRQFFWE